MARSKSQRNRERISRRLRESGSAKFALKVLTPEVMLTLKRQPHPKLKTTELSALDYVLWLAEHGYSDKIMPVVDAIEVTLTMETATESDQHLISLYTQSLQGRVKDDDYGVPHTYR